MTRPTHSLRQLFYFGTQSCALAVIGLFGAGCSGTQNTPVRVAAASDLQSALPKLVERFQARTGIPASITFGASGRLTEQIRQGAPFDVFLSADENFVRDLAEARYVKPDTVHRYARGSLVLAVYGALGDHVQSLADLTRPEVKKIALANPATAPYGRAGKRALERAGLWDRLQPKLVIAESVRQALLYAQKGDVEAALVGKAIADVPEVRSVVVDTSLYDPIIQTLGMIAATSRSDDVAQFIRFVMDPDGQATLRAFGFASVEADPSLRVHAGTRQANKTK